MRQSYRIVLWSVMGWDWTRRTDAERLTRMLMRSIKPGSIVLLHDSGDTAGADEDAPQQMLKSLREVLAKLRLQGYQCVRVDELQGQPYAGRSPIVLPERGQVKMALRHREYHQNHG